MANLTGEQEAELRKLNLLNEGMRDKERNLPVVSSRKIAGPVEGALRNTFEQSKKPKKKKIVGTLKYKASGGRVQLKGGGICKKGMNKKAIGRNS